MSGAIMTVNACACHASRIKRRGNAAQKEANERGVLTAGPSGVLLLRIDAGSAQKLALL